MHKEMASSSIAIAASMHRACSRRSHNLMTRKQQPVQHKPVRSSMIDIKQQQQPQPQDKHVLTHLNVEGQKGYSGGLGQGDNSDSRKRGGSKNGEGDDDLKSSDVRFSDERWRNGTWDLNMFAKNGKIDWDGVIDAEARRRKFLEVFPQAATNQEPVLFMSSIIPWWAWLKRSHLPEAELLNGRAAMVGFFMAYLIDALTGLDMVGQTGNFICKAGVFVTVVGIILFRRTDDFNNIRKLVDEATFYDKQWQDSWKDNNNATTDTNGKKLK